MLLGVNAHMHTHVAVCEGPARKHGLSESQKKWIAFSIYACHPCAGAMLIFSVSFQISSMSSGFP